ncbi:LysR family transcriptional regulator [Salipiger sp. H15]|uniref:LysR family transcriptional regulator n=1 Tax=Alloyangia sp. H15 TaxID=3029062 RepID=A0AAU8APD1_9RHOB
MNEPRNSLPLEKLVQSMTVLAAVYRQQSFAGAAQELGLDPSGVSHRIRSLEEALDLVLFERTTRRVHPTRAGTLLCGAAVRSLDEAARALDAARDLRSETSIRLSVLSALAMKWLIPRMPDAQRAGFDLSVDVREEPVSFETGDVDAGFRFGAGPYPGLHATRLAPCDLQPVIGSRMMRNRKPDETLLRDGRTPLLGARGAEKFGTDGTWADYWRLLGRDADSPNPRIGFDRSDLAIQGAVGGLGIALGRTLLIEDDIRHGLLLPVGPRMRATSAWWLVTTPELAGTEGMQLLRAWLKEQIRLTLLAS